MKSEKNNIAHIDKKQGSCTLEALIALSIFIISVVSVITFSNVVRAEKTVQLALDGTAAEISEDCYAAALVCDRLHEIADKKKNESDTATGLLLEVSDGLLAMTRGSYESSDAGTVAGNLLLETLKAALADGESPDEAFMTSLGFYGDSPASAVAGIAGMLLCDNISEEASHVLGSFLCRMIMPKYLPDGGTADSLETLGIKDGIEGIDFSGSTVLPDGSGIKLVAEYETALFPGNVFPFRISLVSVSYTLSWCRAGEFEYAADDFWSYDNFRRGKLLVADVKAQYPTLAVKSGYVFDLYNPTSCEYTSVVSLNLFASDYSDCISDDRKNADAQDFNLKTSGIAKKLRDCVYDLKKGVSNSNGKQIVMENGKTYACASGGKLRLYVVIPEEATYFLSELENTASVIEASYGVNVVFKGKGKALKGND